MFMTLYPSMYNITPTIFMTSYPICTLSAYCFHDNTTTIPDISHSIVDNTGTVSVSSHKWYTHLYQCSAVSMISQQVCKSSHLAHVWHHTQSTSHHIHTLWHQLSCPMSSQTAFMTSDLLYITSHPLFRTWHNFMYDIMSTVSYLRSTESVSPHPHYWWHHSHYMDGITSSISVTSYPLYLGHNIH